MRCEKALELAAMASRGELEPGKQDRLREHLAGCDGCRGAARASESLDGALRAALGRPPLAIDLRPEVMRRLPAAPAPISPRNWILPPRWAAAAGLAAAAGVAAL